jgi:hypothetical protein
VKSPLPPFIKGAPQMGGYWFQGARLGTHDRIGAQQPTDGLAHLALVACDLVTAARGQKAIEFITFAQHIIPVRQAL